MNNRRNELLLVSAKEYCKCVVEGKTIKYNQLIVNGNFTNSNDWTPFNSNISVSNNVATVTPTGIHSSLSCSVSSQNGHKYLVTFEIKLQSDTYFNLGVFGISEYVINGTGNWEKITRILTPTDTDNAFFIFDYDDAIHQTYYVRNVQIIDLTELGLDNVNSVGEFYETDLGKYILKGNFLSATNGAFIQTTTPINFKGVNIWNEQMELGSLTNGAEVSSSTELRNVGYIKVKSNTKYYAFGGGTIFLSFYDSNKTFIEEGAVNNDNFTTPSNCYYMRFRLTDSYGTTYLHDICISKNVWDENWEEGAYDSNGDKDYSTDNIRCASLISVLPSAKYFYSVGTGGYLIISYYDKNKNFISQLFGYGRNESYVTPSNAYYMTFAIVSGYGGTYNNDIGIFYYGYQRYCGTNVLMEGLVLQKGDTYKSWGLDEISYNNLIPNANQDYVNSNTDSANANAIVYGANGGVYFAENLTSLGFYSGTFESNTTELVNIYMSGNDTNLYFATDIQMTSGHKYYISFNVSGNNASVVGGLRLVNLRLIDLTELGLSALTDKLRIFLQKNYKLPYTTTNKTIKEQLVRTMVDIDLSTLTWTWEGDYWDADISNIDDIKKDYQSDETPNAIAEKYRVVSVNQDAQEGYPVGNLVIEGSEFSGYYIEINSNDSQNAPSGKMLIELLQPTLVMWQTLDIEDYNEFVATDPHIYKLNRDLSDYGVLDVTSDTGTKQPNLTMLNIGGANGDFCYQDGYIYQKTNDIESVWIYQIQISNAPSRMVSRRTINVESENGIDLDFTKE